MAGGQGPIALMWQPSFTACGQPGIEARKLAPRKETCATSDKTYCTPRVKQPFIQKHQQQRKKGRHKALLTTPAAESKSGVLLFVVVQMISAAGTHFATAAASSINTASTVTRPGCLHGRQRQCLAKKAKETQGKRATLATKTVETEIMMSCACDSSQIQQLIQLKAHWIVQRRLHAAHAAQVAQVARVGQQRSINSTVATQAAASKVKAA